MRVCDYDATSIFKQRNRMHEKKETTLWSFFYDALFLSSKIFGDHKIKFIQILNKIIFHFCIFLSAPKFSVTHPCYLQYKRHYKSLQIIFIGNILPPVVNTRPTKACLKKDKLYPFQSTTSAVLPSDQFFWVWSKSNSSTMSWSRDQLNCEWVWVQSNSSMRLISHAI